ncbi:MAG: DUF4279 domain-containing protein, partial [Pseudonocardia sp.]|nr:DUF4279 domain-containing protein [Pseudonocardia sp.]
MFSESMRATEITARLMIEPDRVATRGSRVAEPPRPVYHSWEVVCDGRGMAVDEQVRKVVDRVRPRRAAIAELTQEPDACCGAVLAVVRHFDDEDGEEEELSPPDAPLQKLSGQHQLLGWHLDRDILDFLFAVNAEIDVDEYG